MALSGITEAPRGRHVEGGLATTDDRQFQSSREFDAELDRYLLRCSGQPSHLFMQAAQNRYERGECIVQSLASLLHDSCAYAHRFHRAVPRKLILWIGEGS
ncbi:hypothetical protein C3486_26280 [Streptomyces sp. Ru73]|nr:hypothetical protein C3486_26280 [Streptomyces sp. Ru73]